MPLMDGTSFVNDWLLLRIISRYRSPYTVPIFFLPKLRPFAIPVCLPATDLAACVVRDTIR